MRIAVVGGPLDGLDARAGVIFGWITERKDAGVVFCKRDLNKGTPRHLYRRTRIDQPLEGNPLRQVEVYIYAGGTHWYCEGCGGFMRKVEGGSESTDCQLCGATPVHA